MCVCIITWIYILLYVFLGYILSLGYWSLPVAATWYEIFAARFVVEDDSKLAYAYSIRSLKAISV